MHLRKTLSALLGVAIAGLCGCSTVSDKDSNSHRARVTIQGVSAARLQPIILKHMTSIGYNQVQSTEGFLMMERQTNEPVPGTPGALAVKSRIQIALQETESQGLEIFAVEYITYLQGSKTQEREASDNQVFMQGLLEGFKAKALYGEPKATK